MTIPCLFLFFFIQWHVVSYSLFVLLLLLLLLLSIINSQFFSKYNNFIFAHVKRMIFHVKKTRIFFLFLGGGKYKAWFTLIIQVHLRKLQYGEKLIFFLVTYFKK